MYRKESLTMRACSRTAWINAVRIERGLLSWSHWTCGIFGTKIRKTSKHQCHKINLVCVPFLLPHFPTNWPFTADRWLLTAPSELSSKTNKQMLTGLTVDRWPIQVKYPRFVLANNKQMLTVHCWPLTADRWPLQVKYPQFVLANFKQMLGSARCFPHTSAPFWSKCAEIFSFELTVEGWEIG